MQYRFGIIITIINNSAVLLKVCHFVSRQTLARALRESVCVWEFVYTAIVLGEEW